VVGRPLAIRVATVFRKQTCKRTVKHGRVVVGAIEMTWLCAPRFVSDPVGIYDGIENIKIDKSLILLVGLPWTLAHPTHFRRCWRELINRPRKGPP